SAAGPPGAIARRCGWAPLASGKNETALRARVSMQRWRRRAARPNIRTISAGVARSFAKSRSTAAYVVVRTWAMRTMSANAGRRRLASALATSALGLRGAPGKGPKPISSTRIASPSEHADDLVDGGGGRELAGSDLGLDRSERRFDCPIR